MTHIPYNTALPKDPDLQPSDIPFRTCRKPIERNRRPHTGSDTSENGTFKSMRALLQRLRLPHHLPQKTATVRVAAEPASQQRQQFMATHPRPGQQNQLRAEKRF